MRFVKLFKVGGTVPIMEKTKVLKAVDAVGWLGSSGYQIVVHCDAPRSDAKAVKYAKSGDRVMARAKKVALPKKKS